MKKTCLFLLVPLFMAMNTGICQTRTSRFSDFIVKLKSLNESERESQSKEFLKSFPVTPVYENDTTVSLYWYGKAKNVSVNGDLQSGWSKAEELIRLRCGDNSLFYKTFNAPVDARLDYQFIIDTIYTTDPRNPDITPSGFGPHSQIAMPGFKSDPARIFRADVPHGKIDSLVFTSRNKMIKSRMIKVYVPAGDNRNMPVLFVYDGIEAISFMPYPVILDNLIADKKIRPVVVVFIPPVDRFRESMGDKCKEFTDVLADELVPFIDERYKTSHKAIDRGITGISAGGHLALYTVLNRPDVIACGAGQSSSITPLLKKSLKILAKKKDRPGMKVYLDVGRFDLQGKVFGNSFLNSNKDFSEQMDNSGIKHVFHIVNDGHSWANWRERTSEILELFFK